jgi:NADH/F420H2 dehydrogenase subunit C
MTKDELKAYISSHFDGKLTLLDTGRHDPMFLIKAEDLLEVCRALRDDENLRFDNLCNLGGVDTKENFEVVYNLASIYKNLRLDFKLVLPYEGAEVDSVQEIWPGANWYERELWELYGINVRNHGNLKRFLLPDDWNQGHPMRKDWSAPDFIRLPEVNT